MLSGPALLKVSKDLKPKSFISVTHKPGLMCFFSGFNDEFEMFMMFNLFSPKISSHVASDTVGQLNTAVAVQFCSFSSSDSILVLLKVY